MAGPFFHTSGDVDAEKQGSLEGLDYEVNALEETIKQLEIRIGPILSQYAMAEAKMSDPRPEPASQLRGRVERLVSLRGALNDIITRVDL